MKVIVRLTCAALVLGRMVGTGFAEESESPAYYAAHLKHVVERVGKLAETCDDGFWFLTDPHIKSNHRQSGRLLSELVHRTPITKVLCGGDLVEAFGKGFRTDKEAVDFAINAYRKIWVEPIRAAGGRFYSAKGNHDFTVCHSYDSDEDKQRGFTYDGIHARELVVGEFTERDIVTDETNPESCYYFFDNAKPKIRYVVADTTDTQCAGDVPWGVCSGMHEKQLVWLAEKALGTVPAGYDVVVMHHIPIVGLVASEGEERLFAPFRRLLEAYQHRQTVEVAGRSCDFTKASGRILLDITGHHHCEMLTYRQGILHVTLPCDAAYEDYIHRSTPWCGTLPKKVRGTVAEQTFDAVQLDRRRGFVYFTRVGGGQDRMVHLDPLTVRVGETMMLPVTQFVGPVTWGVYDADRVTNHPHPTNPYIHSAEYHATRVEVSFDGHIRGLRPGDAVLVASDAALNREIFPVRVD